MLWKRYNNISSSQHAVTVKQESCHWAKLCRHQCQHRHFSAGILEPSLLWSDVHVWELHILHGDTDDVVLMTHKCLMLNVANVGQHRSLCTHVSVTSVRQSCGLLLLDVIRRDRPHSTTSCERCSSFSEWRLYCYSLSIIVHYSLLWLVLSLLDCFHDKLV